MTEAEQIQRSKKAYSVGLLSTVKEKDATKRQEIVKKACVYRETQASPEFTKKASERVSNIVDVILKKAAALQAGKAGQAASA